MSDSTDDLFDRSYADFADAIFRHCAYRLLDRERGRDVMQEAFLRLWQQLQKGVVVENMRAFLYRIANNLIIDEVRKKKERSLDQLMEAGFDPGEDKTADLHTSLQMQQILKVLKHLDIEDREVIVLRYIDDLGPSDIAPILGITPNATSVRIHRAVSALRTVLQQKEKTANFGKGRLPESSPL